MCQLTPLLLSKDSIVLAFCDSLFVKTNCRITVAFTYLLKRGTSWNELELPETSWNHLGKLQSLGTSCNYLKRAVTNWNHLEQGGTTCNEIQQQIDTNHKKFIGRNRACNIIVQKNTTLAIVIVTKGTISDVCR